MNEGDVTAERSWLYEMLCQKVIASLTRNSVDAEYASNRADALGRVIAAIPEGASIGLGDSVTLFQIGFFDWLKGQTARAVFNPFAKDDHGHNIGTPDERYELMRKAMVSDVFLASSNAVTLDGKLVNVDGKGNRVAPMIFGPRKILLVIGANKIVRDTDEAFKRIKLICAPTNARRHYAKHHYDFFEKLPCVVTGTCADCKSPMRICRKIVVIDGEVKIPKIRSTSESGLHVIMVGEALGI